MSVLAELERVLDDERAAILSGDYSQLEGLEAHKYRLANAFERIESSDPAGVEALRQKTLRNQALLAAAGRGFQAALTQVRDLRSGAFQATYSRSGKRSTLTAAAPSVEQKC
jgi:flagellar biosynthesis/type III secretory pathway chaperone